MSKMARTSSHWNKNVACAISVKTTGPKIRFNEVYQLSVIPLLSDYTIDNTILPLNLFIKPENPELISWPNNRVKRNLIKQAIDYGINQEDVPDHFETWFENKLKPGYNVKGYNKNKILPVVHNYYLNYQFLNDLLTPSSYEEWFDWHIKDLQNAANIINDVYAEHGEKVPYSKTTLSYLQSALGVTEITRADALQECVALSKCYALMVRNLKRSFKF